MRVDDTRIRLDGTPPRGAGERRASRPEAGAGPTDRVGLSAGARVLAGLRDEIGPLDEVREERVAGLRAAVGTGRYHVAAETVARDLLVEELGGLSAWAA